MDRGGERPARYRVVVCRGPECGERKCSRYLWARIERLLRALGLQERVDMEWQSCFGRCKSGPNILVQRIAANERPRMLVAALPMGGGGTLYNGMRPEDLRRMLEEHVRDGRPVQEFVGRAGVDTPVEPPEPETPVGGAAPAPGGDPNKRG